MNTTTTTTDNEIISLASVTCEELDDTYFQFADGLREEQESEQYDSYQIDDDNDDDHHGFNREPREDNFRDDVDADANALAGAGYGTDEDYGYFGGDEWWA